MLDWTAIATLALGAATVWLGIQARNQVLATKAADQAQQRAVHILAVRPLLIPEPTIEPLPTGLPYAKVRVTTPAEFPILNLNVTVRGQRQDGADSVSVDRGSLAPESVNVATMELAGFTDLSTSRTWGPGLEVVLTYRGLLDQWVVEHYEWLLNEFRAGEPIQTWRLYRLEIAPEGVLGAKSLDRSFGAPPAYS